MPIGTNISLDFAVPLPPGESKHFELRAKVCRVTSTGVGVEFLNVPSSTRSALEEYVRSVLPSGKSTVNAPRASSVEYLEQIRGRNRENNEKRKTLFKYVGFGILLVGLNVWQVMNQFSEPDRVQEENALRRSHLDIDGKRIEFSQIRGISRDENGHFFISVDGQPSVLFDPKKISDQLPAYLRQTTHVIEAMPKLKKPPENQTSSFSSPARIRRPSEK
jgi:hypothetical protein